MDSFRDVCHDVRNELAAVAMALAAIGVDDGLPAHLRARLRLVQSEMEQLTVMLQSAFEGNRPAGPVDVAEIVEECTALTVSARAVSVEVMGEPALVVAERSTVHRIVMNLLDNAVRATGDGGSVTVEVSSGNDEVVVDIRNSGPAFGATAPGTASMGLQVVDRLVRAQGGQLQVVLGELGGAHVRISLPPAGARTSS